MEEVLKLELNPYFLIFLLFLFLTFLFSWLYHSFKAFSRIRLSGVVDEMKLKESLVKRAEDVVFLTINFATLSLLLSLLFLFYSWPVRPWLEIIIAFLAFLLFYISFPWMLASRTATHALKLLSKLLPFLLIIGYPFLLLKKAFTFQATPPPSEVLDAELDAFIDEGKEEKIIKGAEEEIIRNVVEFSETTVKEIMTPRREIFALPYHMKISEAAKEIAKVKRSRIPVYKEVIDNVEGILYAKDLLAYFGSEEDKEISKLLRKAYALPETTPISKALRAMQKERTKIAIVIDEYGGVSGLITLEDIIEELIGEITEIDEALEEEIIEKPGYIIVKGDTELDEVEDALDLEFPSGDYSTIAGLIMNYLGKIPLKGEKFELGGAEFEVLDADAREIKLVKILKGDKKNGV